MATTVQVAGNLSNELARLQKELDDPLTERKQTSLASADAGKNKVVSTTFRNNGE